MRSCPLLTGGVPAGRGGMNIMKSFFNKLKEAHKGFVILFTVLISAIILMIGFGIFSIATRETILSGTAREAQFSFYAADAGVECALYFQTHSNVLHAGTGFPGVSTNDWPSCGTTGNQINGAGDPGTASNPARFDIMVDATQKTCAHVIVYDPTSSERRIISQGYNICALDASGVAHPVTSNPLLVERVLDTTFSTVPSTTTTPPTGGAPTN
ncbi:MAG: seg [Patescibacteria group bacterium]|nr:seg [Patescibacteria group bacterium]